MTTLFVLSNRDEILYRIFHRYFQ